MSQHDQIVSSYMSPYSARIADRVSKPPVVVSLVKAKRVQKVAPVEQPEIAVSKSGAISVEKKLGAISVKKRQHRATGGKRGRPRGRVPGSLRDVAEHRRTKTATGAQLLVAVWS